MRKTLLGLSLAAAMLSTAASAQPTDYPAAYPAYGAPVAGAIAGSVIGYGVADNWWGGSYAAVGSTVAGAAITGLVAGIGTTALIDAFSHRCRGFLIGLDAFNPGPSPCSQGRLVGYNAPAPVVAAPARRAPVHRRHVRRSRRR